MFPLCAAVCVPAWVASGRVSRRDFRLPAPTARGCAPPVWRRDRRRDDAGQEPRGASAASPQGGILMGKTSIHELSYGWTCNNLAFGAVKNPYDTTRIPGGSSGGSGVAVATHIAPLAVAEDTLGSIRVPASMCGIVGLRPTVGRYPAGGVMPITPRWDMVGPLARSVGDLILFDSVVSGDTSPVSPQPLEGVRIAVAEYFLSEVDPEVSRVTMQALHRLQAAGAVIIWADVPEEIRTGLAITRMVHLFETASNMSAFLAEQETGISFDELVSQMSSDIQSVFRNSVTPGAPHAVTREQYDAAVAQLVPLREGIRRYFSSHNVTVLSFPSVRMPSPLIGEDKEVDILGQKVPFRAAMARNLAHGSCAGMPCLVLPAGMTSNGLPIGLEFDALPGRDRELVALGLSLEKALGRIPSPKV
jgi:indoleacetamide hydrolase